MAVLVDCQYGLYYDTNVEDCVQCTNNCANIFSVNGDCFDICQEWRLSQPNVTSVTPVVNVNVTVGIMPSTVHALHFDTNYSNYLITTITVSFILIALILSGLLVFVLRSRPRGYVKNRHDCDDAANSRTALCKIDRQVAQLTVDIEDGQTALVKTGGIGSRSWLYRTRLLCYACAPVHKKSADTRSQCQRSNNEFCNREKNSNKPDNRDANTAALYEALLTQTGTAGVAFVQSAPTQLMKTTQTYSTKEASLTKMTSERAMEIGSDVHDDVLPCRSYTAAGSTSVNMEQSCSDGFVPGMAPLRTDGSMMNLSPENADASMVSIGRLRADDSLPSEDSMVNSLPVKQWLCQQDWLLGYSHPSETGSLHIAVNIDHEIAKAQVEECARQRHCHEFKFQIVQPSPGRFVPTSGAVNPCTQK